MLMIVLAGEDALKGLCRFLNMKLSKPHHFQKKKQNVVLTSL